MFQPFNWGDTIRIKVDAPTEMRPGELGEIVGIREVENCQQALKFGVDIGAKIYLIEFGDGSSTEVPELFINSEPNTNSK